MQSVCIKEDRSPWKRAVALATPPNVAEEVGS